MARDMNTSRQQLSIRSAMRHAMLGLGILLAGASTAAAQDGSYDPPDCLDAEASAEMWRQYGIYSEGGTMLPFGCANATALGMMVARPGDLIAGRPGGPADGAAAVLAIERYRTGKITPIIVEETTQ